MKCMMFGNLNTGIEKELALEDYNPFQAVCVFLKFI